MPFMGRMLFTGLTSLFLFVGAFAQDTLPEFSATLYPNGRVIISWHNKYPVVTQIGIQRSADSLKDFTTLLSVPDPTIPENGFAVNKLNQPGMFYRLFIVLDEGKYFFTKSRKAYPPAPVLPVPALPVPPQQKTAATPPPQPSSPSSTPASSARPAAPASPPWSGIVPFPLKTRPINPTSPFPVADTPLVAPYLNNPFPKNQTTSYQARPAEQQLVAVQPVAPQIIAGAHNRHRPQVNSPSAIAKTRKQGADKPVYIKVDETLTREIPVSQVRKLRDSILNRTKDTIVFVNADTIRIKRFVPKEVYKVSAYVFTGKDGNIHVALPEAGARSYLVRLLEENNKPLFELKDVKDPSLILDKTNFIHSGWFRYELYEDGRLKEKNKLFIPKDF